MKLRLAAAVFFALLTAVGACEPAKPGKAAKPPRTKGALPAKYPAIIQLTPAEKASEATGLFHSEVGGREMQFLQATNQAGRELVALAELARAKGTGEQAISVVDSIVSTQELESRELRRLAEARGVKLGATRIEYPSLAALTGAKFEKAWIDRLIAVNEQSVGAYEAGAKAGDPEIRGFAEKMLSVAKVRLQVAYRLGGRAPATTSSAASAPGPADESQPRPIPPPTTDGSAPVPR